MVVLHTHVIAMLLKSTSSKGNWRALVEVQWSTLYLCLCSQIHLNISPLSRASDYKTKNACLVFCSWWNETRRNDERNTLRPSVCSSWLSFLRTSFHHKPSPTRPAFFVTGVLHPILPQRMLQIAMLPSACLFRLNLLTHIYIQPESIALTSVCKCGQ